MGVKSFKRCKNRGKSSEISFQQNFNQHEEEEKAPPAHLPLTLRDARRAHAPAPFRPLHSPVASAICGGSSLNKNQGHASPSLPAPVLSPPVFESEHPTIRLVPATRPLSAALPRRAPYASGTKWTRHPPPRLSFPVSGLMPPALPTLSHTPKPAAVAS